MSELLQKIEQANKQVLAHNQEVNKARAKKEALEEQVKKDLLAYNKKYGTTIVFDIDSIKSEVARVMKNLQAQYDGVMKHLDSVSSGVGGTGFEKTDEKSVLEIGYELDNGDEEVVVVESKSVVESAAKDSLVIKGKSKPAFLEIEDDEEDDWFFSDDSKPAKVEAVSEESDSLDEDDVIVVANEASDDIQSMFQSLAKPKNMLNIGGRK